MMRDKGKEKGTSSRKIKLKESDRASEEAIEESRDGNIHVYEMEPHFKNKIEFPFEEFDPIPLDDDDFLDELCYDESEYYDLDEFGFPDDY